MTKNDLRFCKDVEHDICIAQVHIVMRFYKVYYKPIHVEPIRKKIDL
jgi:hypothetical protein